VSGAATRVLSATKDANAKGARVAVVRIDVLDSSGQFLLRELHDLETDMGAAMWTDDRYFPGWLSRPPGH